jgi:CubicO group peptidase (beta-lactamase class C family)
MKHLLVAVCTSVLALAGCGQETTPTNTAGSAPAAVSTAPAPLTPVWNPAPVDATLQAFVDDERAVGASALVWKGGEEVYFGAFGLRDRESGEPMTRDTIAVIYSMTKPITGVALMQLYEQGRFDLDDPIAKYVPELADLKVWNGLDANGEPVLVEPERPPTVRDFTRHTAGLYDGDEVPDLGALMKAANPLDFDATLTQFAARLGTVPLLYQPGTRWLYGMSVDVQAVLVERLAGQPFGDYVQANILTPLGMRDTGYYVPEEKRDRLAAQYRRDGEEDPLVRIPDEGSLYIYLHRMTLNPGGFGLTSTLDDYMRFARMLQNEGELDGVRILAPETVRLMATDHLPETVGDRSWLPSKGQVGFGIDFAVRVAPPASPEENMGAVGEFFWDGAASTLFWVDPANNLTAVFFVQRMPFDGTLHKDFRDAVYAAIGHHLPLSHAVRSGELELGGTGY